MRCPTLNELPPPPSGKTGWPWTEESPQLPDTMPDGSAWPKISIVTPSYNQGQFIEETIRSVLLQGYPDLEYIIMDGGSTDKTIEVIAKYQHWLAYWVSESDAGQSDAINQGMSRATGELLGWLNSDDTYMPDAFTLMTQHLLTSKDCSCIIGHCLYVDIHGLPLHTHRAFRPDIEILVSRQNYICQPATFLHRDVWLNVGGLNQTLSFAMDFDLWLRCLKQGYRFETVDAVIATYRLHNESKSIGSTFKHHQEAYAVCFRHLDTLPADTRRRIWKVLARRYGTFQCYSSLRSVLCKDRESAIHSLTAAVQLNPNVVFSQNFRSVVVRLLFPTWKATQ